MKALIIFALFTTTKHTYADIKGFDDSILYSINWPGSNHEIDLSGEFITVSSSHQENYNCYLPNVKEKRVNADEVYEGPSALGLLSPLFYSKLPCSYRLETYWTYEVCHGRHIRQYHEDREGKAYKLQEFYLGKWDKSVHVKMLQELIDKESVEQKESIPTKKIDGNNLPYFEIVMGNGTLCDLNQNKPRQTNVIYVCYPHSKNEIYSLKETSICSYEIIVLTPLLCEHPKYKPAETSENMINCVPVEGSPNKPYNMIKMKEENRKLRRNSDLDHIRVEFVGLDLGEKEESPKQPQETPTDTSPVESFLAGKNCLNGGTGWWKYEFCYGKSVEQYHVEKDGKKTSINLGLFNKQAHLDWLNKYPHKRPKPLTQRTQLSHLYSGGTVCDKTGKARQTEVKLKCLEHPSNLNTVSLYLLEPKYCEYILGVESPLICDILARADENGLVEPDIEIDFVVKDIPVM